MPFEKLCICPHHEEWGHVANVKDFRKANLSEEAYCHTGKWSKVGNKERKRNICRFCRERLKLQWKCSSLEVRSDKKY